MAEEQSAAVLEYADTAISLGWHDRALPHVRALAARDPLDEAAHARLVMVLAGTGRQAEALRSYQDIRRRLDEELGVLPGAVLRKAYGRILRQEVPVPATPAVLERPWTAAFQLPAAPVDFTGRAAERADLADSICPAEDRHGVPLAVICGPPGAGKTTLALHAAHAARDRFRDGQLWVQLAGASARPRDPGDVLGELLRSLGMPGSAIPEDYAERAVCYRTRLAGRRVLVVADDAATAAQVRPLVPGAPGCALLVTSRARLEGLDGARLLPLDMMSYGEATGLLTQIIGKDRVAGEPDAANALVRACGGLPLAVRIAAAKLAARPSWPLAAMVSRLDSEHGRLRQLEAGDLSVRASIASSYRTLPEPTRRAFRLLALLGPLDFADWAPGVLLGDPDAAECVADELVSRSLLTSLGADATGEARYRLHDLLRDFATERLAEEEPAADRNEAQDRLLDAWLQLAMLADARLPPEPYFPPPAEHPRPSIVPDETADRLTADPTAWFTTERLNLLTAVELACQADRLDLARCLASRQCAFQHHQDRQDDVEHVWSSIADHAERSERPDLSGYARLRIGASLIERGRAAESLSVLNRCVQEAEQEGQQETLALSLYWRGSGAWDLDDFEQARADSDGGVAAARRTGSQVALLMNLRLRANTLARQGNSASAVEVGQQGLALANALGETTYELAALHNLALAYTCARQHQRAVDLCNRQIQMSKELGDGRREAVARAVLGDALLGLGQYEKAVASWRSAVAHFRNSQAHRFHATCLLKLGKLHENMELYPEAISYLEEGLQLFRQLRIKRRAEEAQAALDRCREAC